MGLLHEISEPLFQRLSQLSIVSQAGVVVAGLLFVSVFYNILQQIIFKNPNEPPVVFHWFPVIGSTITYGMDPMRFFKENREKVC